MGLNKICFGMELKTGSFIVGCFSVIGCIFGTISPIINVRHMRLLHEIATDVSVPENGSMDSEDLALINDIQAVLVLSCIGIALLLLALVFGIYLLFGLYKNNQTPIKAYLIFSVLFMLVLFIKTIIHTIYGVKMIDALAIIKNVSMSKSLIIAIVQDYLTLVIGSYFIVVVWSYYKQTALLSTAESVKMPNLNPFCCRLELKTGSFIVGYFSVIGCILGIITPIINVRNIKSLKKIIRFVTEVMPMFTKGSKDVTFIGDLQVVVIVSWVGVASLLFALVLGICLIVGLHKNNRKLVEIYLIFSIINMAVLVIKTLIHTICGEKVVHLLEMFAKSDYMPHGIVVAIVQDFLTVSKEWYSLPAFLFPGLYNMGVFKSGVNRYFLVVGSYFILVVWSYYKQTAQPSAADTCLMST